MQKIVPYRFYLDGYPHRQHTYSDELLHLKEWTMYAPKVGDSRNGPRKLRMLSAETLMQSCSLSNP